MKGWIEPGDRTEFGFGVPIPEERGHLKKRVEFDVAPIDESGQRGPFSKGRLIGLDETGHWRDARPGQEYKKVGVYVGRGLVLTVDAPTVRLDRPTEENQQ